MWEERFSSAPTPSAVRRVEPRKKTDTFRKVSGKKKGFIRPAFSPTSFSQSAPAARDALDGGTLHVAPGKYVYVYVRKLGARQLLWTNLYTINDSTRTSRHIKMANARDPSITHSHDRAGNLSPYRPPLGYVRVGKD